ncbi:toprim domain-containing protein [Cellulosilyticum sp. I15G10I2]|uniref:toprim domain-containing protein n=1 Tax=Cellulosilyticum sp. I15G10I2 TaxID=1892843 RepID=UPI00085C6B47|nr:toprim domain-containing protein [Cellulosilyticum sp. I15G10I2]
MEIKLAAEAIKVQVSAEAVKSKIEADKGLQVKNKKYLCFLHNDSNPSMSYDENLKRFHCFSCQGNYDIFDHYIDYYSMGFIEATKAIIKDFGLNIMLDEEKVKFKPKSKPIKHKAIQDEVVNKYIESRKISLKTAAYVGLKEEKGNVVFEYRNAAGDHISNKYRVAKKVSKDDLKTWFQSGTNCNTLYNMDKVDITKPLVICEGEFDCLSLIEAGYKNAVSIPTGATSEEWISVNYEWLEQFKEIILFFDNDTAGKDGARKAANRLSNDIVKIVYTKKAKDINEILYKFGKNAVINEIYKASEIEIDGVITMDKIEDFNVYEAEKIQSGIKGIDSGILGFIMGSLNIITGYNGNGKSTAINQMCIAESISQGYRTFVFSPELTTSNFRYWLYTTIADKEDFEEHTTKVSNKKYYKVKKYAAEKITLWLKDKLYLYDKNDCSSKSLLKTMDILAKRKGVKVFVIDGLMKVELEESYKNEFSAQKRFVNDLKNFANKYQAIVHLVAHPRKPNDRQKLTKFDVSGSGDITNLCDYCIGVHRTTKSEKEEYEIALSKNKTAIDPKDACITLFKDRYTGASEREAPLYFDNGRKRFYSFERDLNRRYGYTSEGFQEVLDDMPF